MTHLTLPLALSNNPSEPLSLSDAHRLLAEQVISTAYKASQEDGAIKVPVTVYGCEVYVMKAPKT